MPVTRSTIPSEVTAGPSCSHRRMVRSGRCSTATSYTGQPSALLTAALCPSRAPSRHASQRSVDGEDFERRVLTDDREDLCVAGVGSDPIEEHADLELPPLQVGAQHRNLLLIRQLSTAKCLGASADPQLPLPAAPQVPPPLPSPPRGTQEAPPL